MDSGLFVKIFPTIINLKSGLNYNYSRLFTQIIPSIAETSPVVVLLLIWDSGLFWHFIPTIPNTKSGLYIDLQRVICYFFQLFWIIDPCSNYSNLDNKFENGGAQVTAGLFHILPTFGNK